MAKATNPDTNVRGLWPSVERAVAVDADSVGALDHRSAACGARRLRFCRTGFIKACRNATKGKAEINPDAARYGFPADAAGTGALARRVNSVTPILTTRAVPVAFTRNAPPSSNEATVNGYPHLLARRACRHGVALWRRSFARRRRTPTPMVDILILGGGIAGLAAAKTARDHGRSARVLEQAPRPGGILDSFVVDGFRFDNGVHLSFATEPEVRAVFDRTPSREYDAVSFCWDGGYWLRHPVQNNLFPLPTQDKVALIEGLVKQPAGEIRTYRDWLVHQYGMPIAARWLLVYTEKYWAVPAEQLGTDWIGQRIRRSDIRQVLLGSHDQARPQHILYQPHALPGARRLSQLHRASDRRR